MLSYPENPCRSLGRRGASSAAPDTATLAQGTNTVVLWGHWPRAEVQAQVLGSCTVAGMLRNKQTNKQKTMQAKQEVPHSLENVCLALRVR